MGGQNHPQTMSWAGAGYLRQLLTSDACSDSNGATSGACCEKIKVLGTEELQRDGGQPEEEWH